MRKEKIKSLNNFSNIKLCWCYHACCCCDDDNDNDDDNEWKDEINMKKMITRGPGPVSLTWVLIWGYAEITRSCTMSSRPSLKTVQLWHFLAMYIWAATWQNQQNECAPSEDSDQPGHLPSLIRVFAVRMKKAWVLSNPLSAERRLRSDWPDAQAELSLR